MCNTLRVRYPQAYPQNTQQIESQNTILKLDQSIAIVWFLHLDTPRHRPIPIDTYPQAHTLKPNCNWDSNVCATPSGIPTDTTTNWVANTILKLDQSIAIVWFLHLDTPRHRPIPIDTYPQAHTQTQTNTHILKHTPRHRPIYTHRHVPSSTHPQTKLW